jgi:RHS repeat-associated protein
VAKTQQTSSSGATNRVTKFAYNAHGERTQVLGPRAASGTDAERRAELNSFGEQISSRTRLASGAWLTHSFSFDRAGNSASVTQPTGDGATLTTNYSYDALSRLISQSDPFTPGHTTEFTYLPEGQQKDRRDLAGGNLKREVTRTYNADYTLRKEQATDSGEVLTLCNYDAGQGASSGYDANGNLLTSRTVTGSSCDTGATVASRQMTYDHADRLTELVQSVAPQGQAEVKRTQRFSYRRDSVLKDSTWIDGGPASGATARTTTYEHSDGALLESVTDWRASSSSVSTFDHLPSGALTEADLGSGVATGAFSYHPDGSARSLTWDATGHAFPVRAHTQIAYDLGGLRTSEQVATVRPAGDVTGDTGGKAAFSYDLADRLKSWESPFRASPDAASDQPETTYTLDDGGNVVAESTTSQSGSGTTTEDASATYVNGRLQDRSVTTYEPSTGAQQHTTALDFDYTGLGEESERSATTSFAGTSLVVAETRNSSYDPAGYSDVHDHNKTVNGTSVAGEPDLDYLYSASGQVIARKQTSASATSWRYFFYFAGTTSLAEETSEQGATYARYLLASGQAIAEQTYTEDATTTEPGTEATFTFLLTDPDGNVATELEEDGTVAAQRAYDPYGAPDEGGTSEEIGDEPSTLGFQGSHTDRATGSILLGTRIYDPATERFTSPDFFVSSGADLSLGTDPLTGNRYLFAAANPVAFFDDGHAPHYGGGTVWIGRGRMSDRARYNEQTRTYQSKLMDGHMVPSDRVRDDLMGAVSTTLDIVGVFPVAGDLVDGARCGAHFFGSASGVDTALMCGSAFPIVGIGATVAKGARTATRGILKTPSVSSTKLQNTVNNLYKGTTNPNRIGTGTTMDAVRYEGSHLIKAEESVRGLQNWLKANPEALYYDRLVGQSLLDDLLDALGRSG